MVKLTIKLLPLGISILFIIIIGTLFYGIFEDWNYIDSLYFTVMTLTTVGYGDMYPTNNITKLFTIGYVLIGVYLIFYAIRIFSTYYMEKKSPNISRAISQSFEHLVDRKPKEGDVVLKVKPVKNPEKLIKEEQKKKKDKKI